jgi:hypothetical protein
MQKKKLKGEGGATTPINTGFFLKNEISLVEVSRVFWGTGSPLTNKNPGSPLQYLNIFSI